MWRYIFDGSYRLGIGFTHESNASLLPTRRSGCVCNPGSNNAIVTFGIPAAETDGAGDELSAAAC